MMARVCGGGGPFISWLGAKKEKRRKGLGSQYIFKDALPRFDFLPLGPTSLPPRIAGAELLAPGPMRPLGQLGQLPARSLAEQSVFTGVELAHLKVVFRPRGQFCRLPSHGVNRKMLRRKNLAHPKFPRGMKQN